MAFEDTIPDGHTLEPQLAQVEDLLGRLPETALVDRGCKGRKQINEFETILLYTLRLNFYMIKFRKVHHVGAM